MEFTNLKNKDEAIKRITFILRKEHITYEESKYIFKQVRDNLNLKSVKKPERLPKFLTHNEVKSLIETAYKINYLHGLILKTLFVTGIRVSELINLKVEDLILDENKIIIIQGKGKKDRLVLINDSLKNEFLIYLNGRIRGYLFESNRASKFTKRRIQQIVENAGIKAGIEKRVTPHILRHSIATHLINNGMKLDQVQLLLGHKNPRTTEIYAKTSLECVKQNFDRVIIV